MLSQTHPDFQRHCQRLLFLSTEFKQRRIGAIIRDFILNGFRTKKKGVSLVTHKKYRKMG